ncbi:hypothetical protein [Frankia sp. Cr1]|uniref:hypothetical protein n=1 Tax=Frankia sp. Cr1 TaxID=3073931 RepID=UPI002AD59064|nr:hypothetical protein [Frankia sp. Cr1]
MPENIKKPPIVMKPVIALKPVPIVMRHSLDAVTATLARALAGARHPQVEAARRSELRQRAGRSPTQRDAASKRCDQLAARCRTYHTLGVVGGFRASSPPCPGRTG